MKSAIRISAVGDIAFIGKNADRPFSEAFSAVAELFKESELVVGNLESPLISGGQSIAGKCTLRGSTAWAGILKAAGIHAVSLANNHLMDYGEDGLIATIQALEGAGVRYVGAGRNVKEARQPLFMDVLSKRISLLARTSVIVSSPSYAGVRAAGVAFFDPAETFRNIRKCRESSEIVIVLMHWGMEEYEYPSPKQRALAQQLIGAGADAVIGHHPHVLQGLERVGNGIVVYSLGNFVFDDFGWSFVGRDDKTHDRVIELSERNRQSGVLEIIFQQNGVLSYEFHPTRIEAGGVRGDSGPNRRTYFEQLSDRLGWPGYSLFWRMYSIKREWELRIKPLFQKNLTWSKFKKIRPEHFRYLLDTMKRCANITTEKSTNPYE